MKKTRSTEEQMVAILRGGNCPRLGLAAIAQMFH
jgi:hypothetical protein